MTWSFLCIEAWYNWHEKDSPLIVFSVVSMVGLGRTDSFVWSVGSLSSMSVRVVSVPIGLRNINSAYTWVVQRFMKSMIDTIRCMEAFLNAFLVYEVFCVIQKYVK